MFIQSNKQALAFDYQRDSIYNTINNKRIIFFIVSFLFVLLIICSGFFYFDFRFLTIKHGKQKELSTVSEIKVQEIVQWRKERLSDAERISKNSIPGKHILGCIKNPEDAAVCTELREYLATEKIGGIYSDIILSDPQGTLLLATANEPDEIKTETKNAIMVAFSRQQSVISEFYVPADGKIQLDVIAPIRDPNNHPLAAVILSVHADDSLYPLLLSWPTLSRSAEILLVMRQGEDVLFLNNLRHMAGTALSLRIPLTRIEVPAVQAVLGRQGIFDGVDYRGMQSFADLRAIPESSWFMVAKVDADEILVDAYREAKIVIFFVVLFGIMVVAIAGFFYRWYQLAIIQSKLTERDLLFRMVHENAFDAIITIDANGLIEEMNPAAENLFGYSIDSLRGRNIADHIIPPEFRNAHRKALGLHSIVDNHHNDTIKLFKRKAEFPGLHADGHIIDLEVGIVRILMNDKVYFTAIMHDITDRKQLLKSLEETLRVAESANRMKSEFLANMSHEIRTPLNSIIGMTDLIRNTQTSAQDQRHYLEMIQHSSDSLLELINMILDLSKIDAGMVVLERIPFDLSGQLEIACKSLAVKADQKGLEIYCHLAKDLPTTLLGDPVRLRQVLVNLINNAIKFTSFGEIVVRVGLARTEDPDTHDPADQQDTALHFSISDTGIGIPEEKQAIIFERFTQADGSTTRQFGGTGLGLAICKNLVMMMHGQIWVDGNSRSGSIFHFTARFGVGQREVQELESGRQACGDRRTLNVGSGLLVGLRILLADGHATGREVAGDILSAEGAQVAETTDRLALSKYLEIDASEKNPFDLLILDDGLMHAGLSCLAAPDGHYPAERAGRIILLLSPTVKEDELHLPDGLRTVRQVRKPVWKFSLLKAIRQALNQEQPDEASSSPASHNPMLPLNILLVEDIIENQKLASVILGHVGHTVTIANNGVEAVARLQHHLHDLVLMDLQMPEMDGLEATRQIRQADSSWATSAKVPIIAVTAKTMNDEERECLLAGMDGYLRKPYRSKELLDAIAKVINLKQILTNRSEPKKKLSALKEVEMDAAIFAEKSNAFIHDYPEALNALQRAIDDRNLVEVGKQAQTLTHRARELGAWKVSSQGLRLRGYAEQKNWNEIDAIKVKLEQQCLEAKEAFLERGVAHEESDCR